MNERQVAIKEIMDIVHNLCIENSLTYSLCGGSMIGAVREKGFIPWDDDLDIFMPMEDYKKLIDIVKQYEHEFVEFKIPGQDADYKHTFIKAVNKNTTLVESVFQGDSVIGIYIDIFPLVEIKDRDTFIKKTKQRRFWAKLRSVKMTHSNFTLKAALAKPLSMLFSDKFLYTKIMSYTTEDKGYDYIYDPDGGSYKSMFPKEWIYNRILVPFEDSQYYIISEYDKYLTQVFGNYMQRPPQSEWHMHSYVYFNINKPYKEYINEEQKKDKNIRRKL